jgi:hypothetical protein
MTNFVVQHRSLLYRAYHQLLCMVGDGGHPLGGNLEVGCVVLVADHELVL